LPDLSPEDTEQLMQYAGYGTRACCFAGRSKLPLALLLITDTNTHIFLIFLICPFSHIALDPEMESQLFFWLVTNKTITKKSKLASSKAEMTRPPQEKERRRLCMAHCTKLKFIVFCLLSIDYLVERRYLSDRFCD